MSVTVDYAGADGSPFPVTFGDKDDVAKTWRLEQSHSIGCMTPLARAMSPLGLPGAERAYADVGLPFPSWWRGSVEANGWPYYHESGPTQAETETIFAGCAALVEKHGSALGIWRDDSLPRCREACSWLQSAPDAPIAELAEACEYSLHHTMISSMVAGNDLRLVADVLTGAVDDPQLTAHELAQGYENETLRANQRLWEVAQLDRDDPAFGVSLEAFLAEYGWRAEMWTIDSPTWREKGSGFWSLLDHLAAQATSPAEVVRTAAARREELTAELAARFDDPDTRARFLRRVERLSTYVPVREDRAMWQLIGYGSLRHAVLTRGEALMEAGVLDEVDDVFFLVPVEVDDPARVDRSLVAARRADHARWSAVQPPIVVGGGEPVAPSTADVLKGTAASRGTVRGTARVILDLDDVARLEPGDILVCPTTSPPWTPLFGVAAAIVTDSGDLGAHPAIAAREYGLPCVVGVDHATSIIRDGAEIVVDGAAGTVELLPAE